MSCRTRIRAPNFRPRSGAWKTSTSRRSRRFAARHDMLTNIAKFEIRYQLKSPVFWITSAVFFWFAFSLINSDEIQFGWGGYVVRNSPYTTALTVMVLTVFAVFIATTFAASVVLRDDETGFGPICLLYTSPSPR